MNSHPHETKMNIHQHEVKTGLPHEIKITAGPQHEIEIDLHHPHDRKMNIHQHDIKMDMSLHQHDIKMDMSLHQHDIKINAPQHDVKLNQQYHHEVTDHLMEVNCMPQQPQEIMVEVEVNNAPQQTHPINNTKQQQSQSTESEKKAKNDKKKKEAIDGQAREVIFKVIKFFESEKQNRGYAFPVENVVKRACAATGLSESTIKRIKRDGLRAEATQTRMTGPKKKRVRKTKVQLDYYQLCALRGIVNSYSVRKEVPTLGKILAAAKHELNYRGGKESLRLILLNKLGIKFKKCEKKNKKPPEETPPNPVPQMQTVMAPPPMQHMKVMENQCVYTNMIPPVSY